MRWPAPELFSSPNCAHLEGRADRSGRLLPSNVVVGCRNVRFNCRTATVETETVNDQKESSVIRNRCIGFSATLIGAVATLGIVASAASGAGRWNTPSNVLQCLGYGNGPGYHTPMLLGPVDCTDAYNRNVIRMPAAPAPCCSSCSHCAIPLEAARRLPSPTWRVQMVRLPPVSQPRRLPPVQ